VETILIEDRPNIIGEESEHLKLTEDEVEAKT